MHKLMLMALFCLFYVSTVQSAEWSITGSLSPSLVYDDNIFMRDTDKIDDFYSTFKPTLTASHQLENIATHVRMGYVVERYQDATKLNSDNPFLHFDTGYKTERAVWGLKVSYVESSSRDDAADDTGDFETNSIATSESISPSVRFDVTERDVLSVNATYATKEFSTTDFSDSRNRSLTTSWTRDFSERLNGGVSVSASHNESSGLTSMTEDDTYNLSLTSKYKLSEVWSVDGKLGIRKLESEVTDLFGMTDTNSSTGESLSINVAYSENVDTAHVSLSRSLSPSSDGDVSEVDNLTLSWMRDLSEKLSAGINASIQQTTSARDGDNDNRDNVSISPVVNWKVLPNANLSFSYTYRQQKESELDTNAVSNAVMVTFNYAWDGIRFSR